MSSLLHLSLIVGLLLTGSVCLGAPQDSPHAFAVIGDTQRTLPIERILLLREQNDAERPTLAQAIAGDAPEFLVHLGDLVSWGSSAKQWSNFDRWAAPIRGAGIEIDPIVGNHEYFGFSRKHELANLYARFPSLRESHWYLKRYAGLGLVFLDSNQGKLSSEEWQRQVTWYENTLTQLDADPSITGILVFSHHPACSNSKVSADDPSVRAFFLPPFLKSRKTLAYINGHAHGYEHFLEGGKHFIVSGGGGGPRVSYHTGASAKHLDLFEGPMPRPLNYLLVQPMENGIAVTVKGFQKGEPVHEIDRIRIEGSTPSD
jgi:hypothetical protein